MGKAAIIVVILLVCCCLSCFGLAAAFGSFELNKECVYRGPLASNMGNACDRSASPNIDVNDNNQDTNDFGTTGRNYNGKNSSEYTFEYPANYSIDESSSANIIFVYAENKKDNLNITEDSSSIFVNQTNCETYAEDTMDSLFQYYPEINSVSTTTINGLDACKVDFTADYGNGYINQTQYYVDADLSTYVLTITINLDDSTYDVLDDIANTFEVR